VGIAVAILALVLGSFGVASVVNAFYPDDEGTTTDIAAAIGALSGVERVSAPMCRDGDLMTGRNCFVQVHATTGMTDAEQDRLATAIGNALAAGATSSLRLMAELNIDGRIVGLSSTAELNAPRMQIARDLDALAEGDRVAVLWRVENDNLVSDLDNDSLSVTVWSSEAQDPIALWSIFEPLMTASVPHGTLTATIRAADAPLPPNTYQWGVDDEARASWRSVAARPGELSDSSRTLVTELRAIETVCAFEVAADHIWIIATDEAAKLPLQTTWKDSALLEQRQLVVSALNEDGWLY
jgi:hypothetical protein